MTSLHAYTEGLERALAQVIANAQRDMAAMAAEHRAQMAEFKAQLVEAKAEAAELKAALMGHAEALVAKAVEALPRPEPVDLSGLMTRDAFEGWRDHINTETGAIEFRLRQMEERPAPEPVDLSGLVTAESLAPVLDEMRSAALERLERIEALEAKPDPEPVDLSGFASKSDVSEVWEAINPTLRWADEQKRQEPVDHSAFATREELDAVRAAIPVVPEPKDWSEEIGLLDRTVGQITDATVAALKDVDSEIRALKARPEPDLGGFATHADLEAVRAAIPEVPEPKDLEPYLDKVQQDFQMLEVATEREVRALQEQIERLAARPGTFPVVKAWDDGVHYEGALVTHDGALWQAQRDTGKAPGHDDWRKLVAAGRDGADGVNGRSLNPRGTFDPEADYAALDVAMVGGSSFVALHDHPGTCPGDGWQLLASRGSRGKEGEKGTRGDPGAAGPGPVAFTLDEEGVLTLVLANGETLSADFYPLFRRVAQ